MHILPKLDYKNALNSLNRKTMLKHVHAIRPIVCLFDISVSAYSKPTFLIYSDTIISSEKGTQLRDLKTPRFFAETIQVLENDLQSKTLNGT